MTSSYTYHESTALIAISSVSIGLGAIAAFWIGFDIVLRRGWRSMMFIMIPVYVINALYLWPITLWVYLKYGRPPQPTKHKEELPDAAHHSSHAETGASAEMEPAHNVAEGEMSRDDANIDTENAGRGKTEHGHAHQGQSHAHGDSSRPMFATVTVGVCHCGAGCVLGDIVGEWLLYGTNAAIGSPPRLLWTEFLVDFGFAFTFGIFFQYFSIAPMAGDYSPKVLYRALKADALSLLFFEIGLFGWMAIFQIAIFKWGLELNTVTYWWMMQIGMFFGHWTGVPINWWLISTGVKVPCI